MITREEFDWTPIYFIGIGSIILFLIILVFQGKISPDGFVVGAGTFLLALATFYLAYTDRSESRFNREQVRELAEKNRRRLRLKEQFEGFYTPLIGIGKSDFIKWYNHRHAGSLISNEMIELRRKYKFLASDEIMEIFDEYYHMLDADTDDNIPSEDWIMAFWGRIEEDFDRLSQEYSDLTKPVRT